jgi:Ca-activated chloride channel homolog
MSFLNPAAFLFLLGIPAVIILHLLKIRRRQATVSSTLLWADSLRDQQATAPFRRLKPSLLLLLQALIILLLALALARPVRTVQVSGYERTVFILDVSASMQAWDARGSRFTAAKEALSAAVARLALGQQAMLIASGTEARVVVPFTNDREAQVRGVASLGALDLPGRLTEALRLAQANLQVRGGLAAVEVFTDGAFDPPALPDLAGAALHWHQFGEHGKNVGITAFEARKAFFGAADYQAFLSVANYSDQTVTFDLRLSLEGRSLRTERVTLAPELKRSFVVPFTDKAGGLLKADVDLDDDLAADNQAWAVIPRLRPRTVLFVGKDNAFVEKALAADPEVKLTRGTPETLDRMAPAADIVILDNVPVKKVPPGRYILINTVPGNVPLEVLGRVQDPPVLDWDRTHPVMRYLDLSKLVVQDAMRIRPVGSGRSLIDSNLTPLAYAVDEGNLKAVFVGFDLYRTDLPLRVAFPLLISNAVRWLAPNHLDDASLMFSAGQPLTAAVPADTGEATLTDPAGVRHTLVPDANGRVSYADTTLVGVYTLQAGSFSQRFAVNLLNEDESNIRVRTTNLSAPGKLGDGAEAPAMFASRQELWKLLALLALALLGVEAFWYHREVGGRWPWAALAARTAVVLAILGGLWGWNVYRSTEAETVFFVVDASDSVSLDSRLKARQYIADAVKAAGRQDRYGVITFGGSPAVETPAGRELLATRPPLTPDSRATDIGAAIKLALAAFPPEGAKRIVLLSDGNENRGNAREAAQQAKREGADVYVVPLKDDHKGEVLVERVIAPAEVKFGESFLLRVAAWSAQASSGRLSLYRDGQFVGSQPIKLAAGKNVFTYQQSLEQGGFHLYQARIEAPEDVIEENNRGLAAVAVRGKPKVLYVERDRDQGASLLNALRAQNLDVDIAAPEAIPGSLDGLNKYDSVILSNVSAAKVGKTKMELIRSYVRDQGGGLVMLGGDESFGVGGYYHTPIEEALPVTMEARQKVEVPSLAILLIIDRSGSMEETTGESKSVKIELAKEAAQLVVELLDERNEVGVLAFDTAFSWVVPMQPAKNKDAIIQQIATIKAGGGTELFPPLKQAYETIYDRNAVLRHVLVLTDGQVETADFNGLVRRMQKDKITVSTVGIGSDADVNFLTNMSRLGHGRFYYTDDAATIPRILAQETQLASKASLIEQAFRPRLVFPGHEIVEDVRWEQTPPLGGYDSTTPKPKADVLVVSNQSDPVLASWRYGLGRSVAFTSDAKAKWGILWLKWPDYSKLFGQMVRWSLRTTQQQQVTTTVTAADGHGEVTLEAVDAKGDYINFIEASLGVVQPDKAQHVQPLAQIGPGRYRGRFEAGNEGAYLLGISEKKDQKRLGSEVASLVVPYSPELRALAVNDRLLADLASLSGGGAPTAAEQAFTEHRRPARVRIDAWPYLLTLALLLFFPDIAIRRFLSSGRAGGRLRPAQGPAPAGGRILAARFGGRRRR